MYGSRCLNKMAQRGIIVIWLMNMLSKEMCMADSLVVWLKFIWHLHSEACPAEFQCSKRYGRKMCQYKWIIRTTLLLFSAQSPVSKLTWNCFLFSLLRWGFLEARDYVTNEIYMAVRKNTIFKKPLETKKWCTQCILKDCNTSI